MSPLVLAPPSHEPAAAKKRRTRRDPEPHFLLDLSPQLDPINGCPVLSVPKDHVAWQVLAICERFDYSTLEAEYSSLGRRGHRPRHLLAVWILASLSGVHHSTELEHATVTDAAYRLLSGGRKISAPVLRRFRRLNRPFFRACLDKTIEWARLEGLLRLDEIAVDSMRLRAHASSAAVRTVERSSKRKDELDTVDPATLSDEDRAKHDGKLAKHTDALNDCKRQGRSNIVLTNPSAALMKFPDGASHPGHRITTSAAGVRERIIVDVLVDGSTCDYGKLPEAVESARQTLVRCGVPKDAHLQVAADAGYYSHDDLAFADANREWVDVLIPAQAQANTKPDMPRGLFGKEHFTFAPDGTVSCPAGTQMLGPWKQGKSGQVRYEGVGCETCPLRDRCTTAKVRRLKVEPELIRLQTAMRHRMAQPDAANRYGKRIATVEPAFANIGSVMSFRRSSTQHAEAIVAEVLLKVLAHNVSRLIARRAVLCLRLAWVF